MPSRSSRACRSAVALSSLRPARSPRLGRPWPRCCARRSPKPPCVIAFSGGRDSSALLAVAVDLARREQWPLPIPVTLRFSSAATEETAWQEVVLRHLGLDDWIRLQIGEELDLLGPLATRGLRRHGLLYPANAHVVVPMAEHAVGGHLLTGVGGDDVFGNWPWHDLASVIAGRARPSVERCAPSPPRRRSDLVAGRDQAPPRAAGAPLGRRVGAPTGGADAGRGARERPPELVGEDDLVGRLAAVARHRRHHVSAGPRRGGDPRLAVSGPSVPGLARRRRRTLWMGRSTRHHASAVRRSASRIGDQQTGQSRVQRAVLRDRDQAFCAGVERRRGTRVRSRATGCPAGDLAIATPHGMSAMLLQASWIAGDYSEA